MQALEQDGPPAVGGAAYEVTRSGSAGLLVRLSGRLDMAAIRQFGPSLFELARGGQELDLDLGAITSIEPVGLALLIGCRRLAHANGGRLRLVEASPAADGALRRSGLDRLLPVRHRRRPRSALARS